MKKFCKILFAFAMTLAFGVCLFGCAEENIIVYKNGKSAYDIAVEEGFNGTKSEWLASLKGKDGKDGEDGENGSGITNISQTSVSEDGSETTYTITYGNGSTMQFVVKNGKDGTNGTDGKDGVDGKDGTNGIDGKDGADATSITAEALFELGVSRGLYTNDSTGLKKFFEDVGLTSESQVALVGARCFHKVVGIYVINGNNRQMGSGVVYKVEDDCAYIITNYHLVAISSGYQYIIGSDINLFAYGASINYQATDGSYYAFADKEVKATYIGGAAAYDLALLKVTGENLEILKSYGIIEAEIADTNNIQPGITAIAIGNVLGEGIALTSGVVSLDSEKVNLSIAGTSQVIRSLRMDTSINSGNSGGGLFNINGDLIGIVDSKYTGSTSADNICNAIPASDVKVVVENILYYHLQALEEESEDVVGAIHKYVIGIKYAIASPNCIYDEESMTNTLTNEVEITTVMSGSVAENIGLEVGDRIKQIVITHDSETTSYDITLDYMLMQLMLTVREGDTVRFIITRTDASTGETSQITTSPRTITSNEFTIISGTQVLQQSTSVTEE